MTPSSKIFYWPFQGGTSFVDLLCFCSVLCLLCFVRVCLYVLCGHLLGKGWPLGSRLWCLLWVCHFPIGILGQVWYLIVSIVIVSLQPYYFYKDHVTHIWCFWWLLILNFCQMKELTPISKNLHFNSFKLIWSGQIFHVLLINLHPLIYTIKLIALHSFLRHTLRMLS